MVTMARELISAGGDVSQDHFRGQKLILSFYFFFPLHGCFQSSAFKVSVEA